MWEKGNKERERLEKLLEVNVANLVNHIGCAEFSISILDRTATLTLTRNNIKTEKENNE